jgi:CheY-like chemotaxis protein
MTRRVLVVDDDSHIREVAGLALEAVAGWQVLPAGSGLEAVDVAGREHPDAVLLDVMMPGMDGLTTLEHLRREPATRSIPVIFLTAKTLPADHSTWSKLECAGIIAKPFDPMTLAAQMSELLGWST